MSMFSPPSAPDPQTGIALGAQVANTQNAYNTSAGETSQLGSMTNQVNPYGSLTYNQTGTGPNGTPLYTANVQLTPEQQQMFNTLQSTKTSAGDQANSVISNANYGATDPASAVGSMTTGLTSDLLKTQTDYIQPFFTTQRSQLDTQLRNQGLAPGNPAYDNAMRGLDTSQNLSVTQAAGQFEPQAYSQAMSSYLLPAQLGQNLAQFGAPGDATQDLTQTPQLNVQPANVTGATATENTALNNQYTAQMQQYQNMMSGLFGVGSAVLGGWGNSGGLSSLLGSSGGSVGDAAALAAL